MEFHKATKHASKLRLAFIGPAGSGKTYSALSVATALGGKVAVIDTERGSASKYADVFEFDVMELETFAPDMFVKAIHAAESAGYDIIIVDSLSHAWMGKGGALEMVDDHARRERGNSFGAWRHVTPEHNAMVDALQSKAHIIVTMRSKTEWVVEEDSKGKKVPRKIGLAPVQRDGLEYEFDVVGDLDQDNVYVVTKSRCSALAGKAIAKPGEQLAETLKAWLDGAPPPTVTDEDMESWRLKAKLAASISVAEVTKLRPEFDKLPACPRKEELRLVLNEARKDAAKLAAERISKGDSPEQREDGAA